MKHYLLYTLSLYSLLIAAPYLHATLGAWSYLIVPLLASFFIIGIGLLRHEHWHRYDKEINNTLFHHLCSFAMLSDTNCYLHGHLSHHKHVHTEHDLELYGPGYSDLTAAQKRNRFLLEAVLGNIHWELTTGHYLAAKNLVTRKEIITSIAGRAAFIAVLFTVTYFLYNGSAALTVAAHFALSIWVAAVVSRHLQWIQHLGIFVDHKDPKERSLQTRALLNCGLLEKTFNVWTHTEGENHIFHHTDVLTPITSVRTMKLEATAPAINLKDYLQIILSYYRRVGAPVQEKA
ncbi:MAG TPA: fatty acid desaturase [Bacteriovoracaceae bacterium]|nr:fatty acid desaturase [Bacteriovoracaceae bacterium]